MGIEQYEIRYSLIRTVSVVLQMYLIMGSLNMTGFYNTRLYICVFGTTIDRFLICLNEIIL